MSSSKAITEKEERLTTSQPREGAVPNLLEAAPSLMREDEPTFARTLGMIGAFSVIFGGMALLVPLTGNVPRVGPALSMLLVSVGLCGLLFHAAFDRDSLVRLLYLIFAAAVFVTGIAVSLIPMPKVGSSFSWGVPCGVISLLFALAALRNEHEALPRQIIHLVLLIIGGLLAVGGLLGATIRPEFLPYGLVLAIVGLAYLAAFISSRGISDDLAYYSAIGVCLFGVFICLTSSGYSLFGPRGSTYFTTSGALLLSMGILYALTGAALFSDAGFMVLLRRELGAFFYSPIAYLNLFGFVVLSWVAYIWFLTKVVQADRGSPLTEPIVRGYIFDLFPIFSVVLVVPVLTMRLLSEEQRSGTLEVLLTAPVDETLVLLSKFFACLIAYVLMWAPFGLYLLAIPLAGGNAFDYRPLLSFALALITTGSSFVASGLFFSSLTRSQIASAMLTGAFMMLLTFFYFPSNVPQMVGPAWSAVFRHMSYLDLWHQSLDGVIVPKYLLFFLSLTVFFLFLTGKVLESRKWR